MVVDECAVADLGTLAITRVTISEDAPISWSRAVCGSNVFDKQYVQGNFDRRTVYLKGRCDIEPGQIIELVA